MTLEADALLKRNELLSTRFDPSAVGADGLKWEVRVTLSGVEVYRSNRSDDLSLLNDPIFLRQLWGLAFSVWVVGTRYTEGIQVRSVWERVKFTRYEKAEGTLISLLASPGFPLAKELRQRLYAPRTGRKRSSSNPTRHSSPRPSPEIKTLQRVDCRNRDGVFLVLQTFPYDAYSRTWSGINTPNYGTKKKKSRLPINNHSVSIWTQSEPSQFHSKVSRLDIHDNNWWIEHFGDPGSLGLPGSISHLASARNLAIARLIQQAESGIEGNIAQDLAQFGQLGTTLNSVVTRLVKAVSYLKGKNIPGAVEVLWSGKVPQYHRGWGGPHVERPLADNWLAMQYGWKPLLQDVHGAFESLAKFHYADYNIRQVKSSGKAKEVVRSPIFSYGGHAVGILQTTVETRCKFGLRFRLDSALTAFLAQTGFTNPINLFWEVLPYSFVVDWFLPIGPYLETLSSWDGLVFVDGFQTQFTRKRHHGVIKAAWVNGNYDEEVAGAYEAEGISLNREKILSFPTATFPSLKNPFSVTHLLNGLALLTSAFSGGSHPRSN